ncbi:MAG TPA: AIR carboxylase family protein, partial [Flavobacteriales bacterium]|nr:AIR carboxylase family protein [Flavobacteriales bacterium]
FGMTGGEHSVTTPPGGVTATTRRGNLERPLDICGTVAVNGARNAGLLAVQILALADAHLSSRFASFKGEQEEKVRDGIQTLRQQFPNEFDR